VAVRAARLIEPIGVPEAASQESQTHEADRERDSASHQMRIEGPDRAGCSKDQEGERNRGI
jgi:hypothetical protein